MVPLKALLLPPPRNTMKVVVYKSAKSAQQREIDKVNSEATF